MPFWTPTSPSAAVYPTTACIDEPCFFPDPNPPPYNRVDSGYFPGHTSPKNSLRKFTSISTSYRKSLSLMKTMSTSTPQKNSNFILKAERTANLFQNSVATPALVASIVNWKYVNALPPKNNPKLQLQRHTP